MIKNILFLLKNQLVEYEGIDSRFRLRDQLSKLGNIVLNSDGSRHILEQVIQKFSLNESELSEYFVQGSIKNKNYILDSVEWYKETCLKILDNKESAPGLLRLNVVRQIMNDRYSLDNRDKDFVTIVVLGVIGDNFKGNHFVGQVNSILDRFNDFGFPIDCFLSPTKSIVIGKDLDKRHYVD